MANTFTQIYFHLIFSVKGRESLISSRFEEELYKYISGILNIKGQKMIAINGMPDHIHLLIGMKPNIALSDLVRDIKAGSSKFINEKKFVKGKFEWQSGFGAFSYSHSQLKSVISYIEKQKDHHNVRSFRNEYVEFLKRFDIEFSEEYLFKEVEAQR